jgi:hypothetical protein
MIKHCAVPFVCLLISLVATGLSLPTGIDWLIFFNIGCVGMNSAFLLYRWVKACEAPTHD